MFKGPIAVGTIRTSFVLGMRLIVQASTLLLLATILGPDGFGLYAGLGAMAVLLGTLANFGTHLTLLRDVSRTSLYAGGALRLALGTTTICGSILLLIYIFISPVVLQIPDGAHWVILCIGSADVLLQPFLVIAVMERHGQGQVARSQILLILPLCLRLLAVLVVAACAPDNQLIWYALGHLIAVMLPLGYVFWLAPVVWRQPSRWRVARSHEWRGLAGYAVMNASAHGVAELDKMLAIRLLPLGIAGVYSVASRVVGSLVLPVIAMMLAAMPRLFREGAVTGRSLQYWLFTFAGIYGLLAAVFIALASPWVEALLGEAYSGVGNLISLLAYAVPAISVRAAATNVLTTLERPWVRIFLELSGWLVIVVLALLFVRSHGSQGLAISIIYAEWILAAGSVFLISIISASSSKAEGGTRPR
ncbi:MAG TPA: lipopolysaccharide biosynthesis protein [Pseudomonas sabulinigri]|uniref:Polysaccharide biosynthesis protein C-terminal domain-containing protein n=1 Tax=marine sediment metagenome TaxID=412755 RepID=A0A0F9VJG1_9ZZZZ|nr:lipopolysaccharide biosynthesis protein [Halopseudomonas sabulinigri]HEC52385.1 lipopolysaccharide biosynthesis protein [Halopseudomonas sabulinigri]